MFCYKLHKRNNSTVLAVCDHEILGQTFREGNLKLEVKAEFYHEKISGPEISKLFKEADIINLAGKRIVGFAVQERWVDKNKIISIAGVPHAQIIKI